MIEQVISNTNKTRRLEVHSIQTRFVFNVKSMEQAQHDLKSRSAMGMNREARPKFKYP